MHVTQHVSHDTQHSKVGTGILSQLQKMEMQNMWIGTIVKNVLKIEKKGGKCWDYFSADELDK